MPSTLSPPEPPPLVTGAMPPSLLERSVSSTTASVDVVLRTGVASLLAATIAPVAVGRGAIAKQFEAIDFYRSVAERRDREATFVAPPGGVPVRARPIKPPPWLRAVGGMDMVSFESPFVPLNPAQRDSYTSHRRNRIARAQHWRHLDGPRPTMIVVHGFMGSPYLFNSAFFSLPWFYGQGYDVLLVTLPFHGRRAARTSPFSGHGFFAHGVAHLSEAVLQAVSDIRVFVDHLLGAGAPAVGVTGLSLGGYTTAALAVAEPRLQFAIPNAAVTEMSALMRSWAPAGQLVGRALASQGLDFDVLRQALAVHSPLNYEPAVPFDRRFIIGGLGDRLAPPEQSEWLWEHWDRCRVHWYPGNHVVHVNRGDYLRQMGRFLNATGFHDGVPTG